MGISYLIDTHVLLWWIFDDPKLCEISRQILKNPAHKIYVSSASAWEISTKHRIGKMPEALRAGQLQIEHRDPFDRMLMAQAELELIPIITYDKAFHHDFIDVIPGIS